MIKACTCNNPFQDARYGKGMRVHTTDKKNEEHCTVCGGPSRAQQRCNDMARNCANPMIDKILGERLCTENRITGYRQ
jgi:hypothetical protein